MKTINKRIDQISISNKGEYFILKLDERSASFQHKLKRILQQEEFKKSHNSRFTQLTPREIEIFQLLAMGLNNPEIAKKLFISRRTVEQHRKNIRSKLKIKEYKEWYEYALAYDLI